MDSRPAPLRETWGPDGNFVQPPHSEGESTRDDLIFLVVMMTGAEILFFFEDARHREARSSEPA